MATQTRTDLSDAAAVERVLGGDRETFRLLVERHQDRVYRAVWRVARRAEDAEDLTQETFLKAFRSLGSYDARWAFSTWITTIATRTALSAARKRSRVGVQVSVDAPDAPTIADEGASPTRRAEAGQWRRRLREEVDALGERMRVAFGLRYEDGLSVEEVADATASTAGAVRVLLHRARRTLREKLSEFADSG